MGVQGKMICRQCGKEAPKLGSEDICMECTTENIKKIFREDPELKEAFMQSIKKQREELRNNR